MFPMLPPQETICSLYSVFYAQNIVHVFILPQKRIHFYKIYVNYYFIITVEEPKPLDLTG